MTKPSAAVLGTTSKKKDTCGPFRIPGARVFAKHGVPVLKGTVATTLKKQKAAAEVAA